MVRLNKIYTRTGDAGDTGLGSGQRRVKYDARVAAYGEVDELNSVIGLARLQTRDNIDLARIEAVLTRVQNDLFDLGADLCVPPTEGETGGLRVTPGQTEALEHAIDDLNAELQPLRSFVLPGGSPAAAALHQARTVCRRAERAIVLLAGKESVGAPVIAYVNRLSDYLFVAARYANDRGASDVLWVPGANR
ncbi:MAG TPA: cob(I)yrinic acid a,c-diamide adenosyltransferase [Roseiarcus sp.]|nr:cob(I)yrinic acid a,c-diamide adenosyltransferase [Roseiarcus sp.]